MDCFATVIARPKAEAIHPSLRGTKQSTSAQCNCATWIAAAYRPAMTNTKLSRLFGFGVQNARKPDISSLSDSKRSFKPASICAMAWALMGLVVVGSGMGSAARSKVGWTGAAGG